MTQTIAISNQKGGVAKTTTCLSLGASLAEMGHNVLLIDLDPQTNLTLSMGIQPETLHRTVGDALLGNASLVSVSRESETFGLDILPGSQELAILDKVLYGRPNYEFRLKKGLEAIKGFYNTILIDCPPSFGTLTLNALTAANLLIIPVQTDYYAAHALHQVTELVKLVRQKTNPQLAYRVLVTLYDKRNKISHVVLDQMQRELSHALLQTIIEIDTKLRESPAFGQPITRYAPDTRGARQYRELARELLNGMDRKPGGQPIQADEKTEQDTEEHPDQGKIS